MASFSKTQGTTLLSLQSIGANAVVVSPVVNVTSTIACSVFIHLGRDDTSGALPVGVNFRFEGSAKSSGNDQWFTIQSFNSFTTTPESEALTGTLAATSTVLTLASTTNLTAGDMVFIKNTTLTNSEFARIKSIVANTSITVIDPITNAQTGSTVYDQAESYAIIGQDLSAIARVRLVVDASSTGTGRTTVAEAFLVTCDSIA